MTLPDEALDQVERARRPTMQIPDDVLREVEAALVEAIVTACALNLIVASNKGREFANDQAANARAALARLRAARAEADNVAATMARKRITPRTPP